MSAETDDYGFTSFSSVTDDSDEYGFTSYQANPEIKNEEKSIWDKWKNLDKTATKGIIEGVSALGQMIGPSNPHAQMEQEREHQTEELDKLLPTDEGYLEKGLRRGLRQAPSAVAFPGSALQTLPRAISAGFIGEGAKDLGLPEWAQTAAELTAYIGPDVTKKLIEKGADKAIIHQARKLGISDDALTPLLQSEFKQKWLTKLSPRRGETQSILKNTKEELSEGYTKIQKGEQASKKLDFDEGIKLAEKIDKELFEMPSGVRSKIAQDLKDLYSKDITGDTLINFFRDVNHETGKNSKQLSLLKEPIKEALQKINPYLAKDFDTINDLFSKYYKISAKLEPNLKTDLMGATKSIALLTSIATGNYIHISGAAGYEAAGQLAKKLLLKPRFQQIAQKTVEAMNQNKSAVVKKLSDLMSHEMKKYSPELSKELGDISEEDLKKALRTRQKEQQQAIQ